jgi:hypothetical protein
MIAVMWPVSGLRPERAGREGVEDPSEHPGRLPKIAFADLGAERVRPSPLGGLDLPQSIRSLRRQPQELRPTVNRVVLVGGNPVGLEQVGHALDALPGEVQSACDLGDARRAVFDGRHDLPAGARLPGRSRKGISGRAEQAVELEDSDPKLAQGITSRRSSILRCRRSIDSILSS